MDSFLRCFSSTAARGRQMYFGLVVASAIPLYAVLNESSKSAPSNSRSNVFVSSRHIKRFIMGFNRLSPYLRSLHLCFTYSHSSTSRLTKNRLAELFSSFLMTKSQGHLKTSGNLQLVSMVSDTLEASSTGLFQR